MDNERNLREGPKFTLYDKVWQPLVLSVSVIACGGLGPCTGRKGYTGEDSENHHSPCPRRTAIDGERDHETFIQDFS